MLTCQELTRAGVPFEWSTPYNESLITRGRNNIVSEFLETDYQALMFIDADIMFTPEDVSKLWNHICEGKGVVCGIYPMKKLGEDTTAWVDGKLVPRETLSGLTEVDFAGTGFMMINRDVLEKMISVYSGLKYEEKGVKYALFDTQIDGDVYLSEDYTFCKRYRALGGRVLVDPSISLKHIGSFTYGN
jgi:hypothetical protein